MSLLRFTFGNAKLKGIYHYSLPSGYTCPGAKNCKTFADKETGKVRDEQIPVDGQIFRCYAAMDEARRPNVRKVRWDNFDLLKGCRHYAGDGRLDSWQHKRNWIESWRDLSGSYRWRLLFSELF